MGEETAVEHYVTWAQARKDLGAAKLSRKFPKGIPTPGAIQDRIKCWNCQKTGHFSRNCKEPRRAFSKGKGKGKGKGKRGNFYLDGGDGDAKDDPEQEEDDGIYLLETEDKSPTCIFADEEENEHMSLLRRSVPSLLLGEDPPDFPIYLNASTELREPGWLLPDSGAGLMGMGVQTYREWRRWLRTVDQTTKMLPGASKRSFRFGNSSTANSEGVAVVPLGIKNRYLLLAKVHLLPGNAPFLGSNLML